MAKDIPIPTKNAFGQIPVAGVEWFDGSKTGSTACPESPLAAPYLRFIPEETFADAVNGQEHDLVDLVSILESCSAEAISASKERVIEAAQEFGPLFGADRTETVADWLSAASAAFSAVRIQEVVNKSCDIGLLKTVPLEKTRYEDERGARFELFSLALRATGAHKRFIGNPRSWYVRHGVRRHDYSFVFTEEAENDSLFVLCSLARFRHSISTDEYLGLCYALELDKTDIEGGAHFFGYETDQLMASSLSPSSVFCASPASITGDDLDALETLVKLLASIHSRGTTVDFVNVDEATGFLSFDNYLSWLWYDFAVRRSDVRVGYCEECGRAFSLVGHRGLERRYCSRDCKTKAHNDENRKRRETIRRGFVDGASIAELARDVFGKDDEITMQSVRKQLENWPYLKHLVNDAAKGRDIFAWADEDIVKRCRAEGLELSRLMSKAVKVKFLGNKLPDA